MTSSQFNISTDVKTEKSSSFCQCCLLDTNLKSMTQSYIFGNHVEVYSKMLSRCFSIQIIQNDESSCYICNDCILKLRQCYSFKHQVEKTQNELNNLITSQFSDENIYDDDSMNCVFDNKDSSEYISKAEDLIVQEIMNTKKVQNSKIEIGLKIEMDDSDENIPIKKIRKKMLKAARHAKTSARKRIQENLITDQEKSKKKIPSVKPWKTSGLKFDEKTCTCSICNETFTGQKPLTAHMGLHFPNFVCDLCGKSFVARKNLTAHLKKTHDDEMITCMICNKLLKKNSLTRHVLSHDSIKDKNVYACPSCPERFDSFFKRIKHLAAVHNKTNYKYSCKFCCKEYRMSSGLSRHIRSYHLQEKKYTCEECGLSFFSNGEKRDHMVKHNGNKIHECHICLKSYARKKTLREHLRIHDPLKRYKCTICERQFTQKCSLVGHMKIHDKSTDSKIVFF